MQMIHYLNKKNQHKYIYETAKLSLFMDMIGRKYTTNKLHSFHNKLNM